MPRIIALPVILVAVSGVTGCAYKPHSLSIRDVGEYPNAVRHQSLRLAAEAWDETKSRSILNEPVNRRNHLPVLVVMKNDGSERAVVDSSNINLADGRGRVLHRQDASTVAKECEKSVFLHVFLFGWLSGLGAAQYNQDMVADWQQKELPHQVVIEPHASIRGLLFYNADHGASTRGGKLNVPVAIGGAKEYQEVSCVLQ